MKALEDPSNRVRANALNALKSLGGQEFIALIKQMVNSPSADVRHSILFVLKNMTNTIARDSLFKLLKDQDSEIQRQSGTLLAKFNDLDTVKVLTDTVKDTQSQVLKDICIKSLGQIRKAASPTLLKQINNLIKSAIQPEVQRQQKEHAVAVEIQKAQLDAAKKALENQEQQLKESGSRTLSETSGDRSLMSQTAFSPIDDADLLAELASFSEPGDISPSKVAARGRNYDTDNAGSTDSSDDEASLEKAEQLEREQEAFRKIINRLNTALKLLEPRLKLEAEKQIKMGKIKNEAQLKVWLTRVNAK